MYDFYTFYTHGDVTAAMLVVKKNKSINFSPLGTKLYFHVNSARKIYIVLTFNKAAFSPGGGRGGYSHMKQTGMLVGHFEFNP